MFTCERMKLDPYFIPLTKINSKGVRDLSLRTETVKLLQENIGKNLLDTGLGNDFLDITPKAQVTKQATTKQDYINLKSFCIAKETVNEVKRQPMEWEKIFTDHIPKKGLISKMYKTSYNSTATKTI